MSVTAGGRRRHARHHRDGKHRAGCGPAALPLVASRPDEVSRPGRGFPGDLLRAGLQYGVEFLRHR
jgi:hypothetical protein